MKRRGSPHKGTKAGAGDEDILYQQGDVKITKNDVERAIEEARERVGPEFAELLTAPAMTEEEMDAVDQQDSERKAAG